MQSRNAESLLIAGIALAALVAGVASGDVVFALLVAVALYAARQAWIRRRLAQALRDRKRLDPPFPDGPWRDIFGAVRTLQLRSRKRKRRLKRFVSRFQEAAAALPDAVVVLGRDDQVQWRNPAAERLLGLKPASCLGKPITALIRHPVLGEHLRGRQSARPLEIPSPSDSSIMLSVLVTPFGSRRQRVLVARDVTRIYHVDRTRKDFVANVSHEFRTPLTVISGNLELLEESGVRDATLQPVIDSMRDNVERMRALVEDLLALSRLDMDLTETEHVPVDVGALLESIVRDARVLAAESGHVLTLEAEPGLWLRGSASELQSAFANLVGNAVRHTPPRTAVAVRWSSGDDGARMKVSDNGPGIAARHLPRLTERFYRVDPSRSARTGGTGLGLAIVKHALERHDATLVVNSREGEGTTFECHFPAHRVATMPAEGAAAAERR